MAADPHRASVQRHLREASEGRLRRAARRAGERRRAAARVREARPARPVTAGTVLVNLGLLLVMFGVMLTAQSVWHVPFGRLAGTAGPVMIVIGVAWVFQAGRH